MKWRRSKRVYLSDCGSFTIKKEPTHDAGGHLVERYPWKLFKEKTHVCSYGSLGEAKAGAE